MRNQSPLVNEIDTELAEILAELYDSDDDTEAETAESRALQKPEVRTAASRNPDGDVPKTLKSTGPSIKEMALKVIAEKEARAASQAENVIQFPAPAPAEHLVAAVTTPSTEPVPESQPAYSFPTAQDDGSAQAELREEIESLVYGMNSSADYMTIRERYCAVSVMLNLHGQWAPAFRPNVGVPFKKAERLPVHILILRDRIVLDCHWLHSRGERVNSREANWRNLIKLHAPFSFELAADFAQRNIKVEARAEEVLGLTIVQQAQLRGLRGKTIQSRIDAIDKSRRLDGRRLPSHMETVEIAINTWCGRDRRIVSQREKYLAVARAEALLQGIGLATWAQRADLAALIEGAPPLSESTYRGLVAKITKKMKPSA